ncbi:DUF3223 domain-containing protein [Sinorhizobium medicae]|nr:DUF3223 domain-containing protein [Sinorhizobium medicae]
MPVTIGSKTLRTRQDAIAHCQSILHREQLETEIEGEDEEFVRSLLNLRVDKIREIGARTVVRFWRKKHRHNTPCFFAELSDGSLLDFSFMKAIDTL